MSFRFTPSSTDIVIHGSDVSLDNLNPQSFLMWGYLRGPLITGNYFMEKDRNTGTPICRFSGTSGDIRFDYFATTTNCVYITNDTPLATLNKWYFIAFSFDTSAAADLRWYVGGLSNPAIESTYSTASDSVDALTTNATRDLHIGNGNGLSQGWPGDIDSVQYYNAHLSLAQIRYLQYRMHTHRLPGCVLHSVYDRPSSNIHDFSTKNNSGSIVGTIESSPPVPLRLRRRITYSVPVAGGNAMPIAMNHYRRHRVA